MPDKRPSNQELIESFRELLTDGFYTTNKHGEISNTKLDEQALRVTRQWRGDMWKKLNEMERRMCPMLFDENGDRVNG